jgi:guanine nucleotide-binding protein alpha-1 subunit
MHIYYIGTEVGRDWYMFDVGGTRTSVSPVSSISAGLFTDYSASQRAAWFPYFEDCNAIIFMAPISCFDENLNEDRRVNRVTDSLLLWKAVCNSKLLSKVQFVLFLNKCDLLARKLKRGIARVQDHFCDFGDQSNDLKTVASCERYPCPILSSILAHTFRSLPTKIQEDTEEQQLGSTIILTHDFSHCTSLSAVLCPQASHA